MATVKNDEAQPKSVDAGAAEPHRAEAHAPTASGGDHGHAATTAEREPRAAAAHERDEQAGHEEPGRDGKERKAPKEKRTRNNVRKIRMERMMSKAELARRAAVSTLTIDRVERGLPCRMDTKRKILEALGLNPSDRVMVFGQDD
jgi:DNA-binding XRE family transcriptional regulator